MHSVGQSNDGAAGSDDGYPDDQRSEPVDENGVEEGANDTGENCISESLSAFIDIGGPFLNIVKTKLSDEVVVLGGINVFWKLIDVWNAESSKKWVSSVSNMSGRAIAVGLWHLGSSMAVKLGVNLSWAGVDADSSWLIACSHDVVELWVVS